MIEPEPSLIALHVQHERPPAAPAQFPAIAEPAFGLAQERLDNLLGHTAQLFARTVVETGPGR
jgi:hypothetical protein